MSPSTRWTSRPLFVSSTFEDMHAERDHLQQYVFPELEEWLQVRRIHLETTDLRWGIETMSIAEQEAKELMVLQVCLAEIDRCRPFMIVLLGDRYGWIPPPARVQSVTSEVGLVVDSTPRSATALEVEYGALLGANDMRPLFYFRERLPYDRIPPEVAVRYTDEIRSSEQVQLLRDLKARIRERFPDRVRSYAFDWNAEEQRPCGLTAFGTLVLNDLKAELETEVQEERAAGAAADWREEEEQVLDAFIESRFRDAHGRASLVEQITQEAIQAPAGGRPPSCTVVVGDSGAGKSVVFAMLARRLLEAPGILLLKHSAGVSPLSITVHAMLRRWCGTMAQTLGEPDTSEPLPAGAELFRHFASLLRRAAERERVVMLVDALDQFERSPEAAYLTWLPDRNEWPDNVVMLATAIGGTETGTLALRGAREISLPPLEREEADAIAAQICARYRKTLPQAVTAALLEKRRPDGVAASSNPLWLSLAVNELLFLDAEDFALLPQFTGTAEERLLRLLVHAADSMPAILEDAYEHVYARVERTYGRALVTDVLGLLSLARFGLRESDLHGLLRGHVGWDAASFAALRRALRTHIGERGKGREWAFLHQHGRRAALERYAADSGQARTRHRELASHLAALPAEDPLRHETMYHLVEADARAAAHSYWRDESGEELQATYDILRQVLLAVGGEEKLPFVLALLEDDPLNPESDEAAVRSYLAGQRLLEFTETSRLSQSAPHLLLKLLDAMSDALQNSLAQRPSPMLEDVLYRVLQNLGMLHADLNDLDAAEAVLERAAEINDRHAEGRKRAVERASGVSARDIEVLTLFYHHNERDRMLNLQRLGHIYLARHDPAKAGTAFERALKIAQYFLDTYPQSELAATDMASCCYLLGDLSFYRGDAKDALKHYGTGVQHTLRDFGEASKPSLVHLRIRGTLGVARAHARLLMLRPALEHYAQAVKLARDWARSDPGDPERQWALLNASDEAGDFLGLMHEPEAAFICYRNNLETCAAMLNAGHASPTLVSHIHHCYKQEAIILEVLGDMAGARTAEDSTAYFITQAQPTPTTQCDS